jgi:hypothetical protein
MTGGLDICIIRKKIIIYRNIKCNGEIQKIKEKDAL